MRYTRDELGSCLLANQVEKPKANGLLGSLSKLWHSEKLLVLVDFDFSVRFCS